MNRSNLQARYFGTRLRHAAVHACGSCRATGQSSHLNCEVLNCEVIMRVIAEGYGGQPLDRVVAGEEGYTVFLVNPNVNRTAEQLSVAGVGFPRSCVFRFSDSLWKSLSGAWARQDDEELTQLWSAADRLYP